MLRAVLLHPIVLAPGLQGSLAYAQEEAFAKVFDRRHPIQLFVIDVRSFSSNIELINWVAIDAFNDRLKPGEANQGHHFPQAMHLQDAVKALGEPGWLASQRNDFGMKCRRSIR